MTDIATEQPSHVDAGHEHGWVTESSHPTSEGTVVYVRCVHCGVRRVDLQHHPLLPPRSLTQAFSQS
jgi:hypothetical protein